MNILIFGPNGSGKGTQGAMLRQRFGIPHIESGALFRQHIANQTPLGVQAQDYIQRGELVPDSITIPMMIERLKQDDCKQGWILDGFPRSPAQARSLANSLHEAGIDIDGVVEIVLDREQAKQRILGRRLCVSDNSHANHTAFKAIAPVEKDGELVCRVCGSQLVARADDQDERAINKRHDIYYDTSNGTLAAIDYLRHIPKLRVVSVDGSKSIAEVTSMIVAQLHLDLR